MPRLFMLLAVLSIGLLFLFPMWKIHLYAPQYPEGLEMHIWINKIGGNSEFTLQNFNILNHYIGMEEIKPDSFKELKIMPWVVVFFMVSGGLLSIYPLRALILSWTISLMIAGAAGLIDFYMWLVKFGTNLDPSAPIKIPGMTYIPPFLGPKQLLNFDALSLPSVGGVGVMMAVTFSGMSIYNLYFKKKPKEKVY
jgi:copper chaperone NosL